MACGAESIDGLFDLRLRVMSEQRFASPGQGSPSLAAVALVVLERVEW